MKNKRIRDVHTYFTEKEHEIFLGKVMQSGLSQAEFIRRSVLENETNFSGQILVDKLIELDQKINKVQNEILKKNYLIENLAVAILVELSKREGVETKEAVAEFITRLENEAENIYGRDDG